MKKENTLGLTEFIAQVKQDLLTHEMDASTPPLFSIDEITLELQVTVEKTGGTGVNISVLQAGVQKTALDTQTIQVKLTPLLSREQRITLLQEKYPELWKKTVISSAESLTRGEDI
ncbi:MAG: trypco2 family protein [Rhodothermales bacterium]